MMTDRNTDAITAAAGAIWDAHTNGPVPTDKGQWCNFLARAAVKAATPIILAAERERVAALLQAEADDRYDVLAVAAYERAAKLARND